MLVREKAQELIQQILEEEVTELLGRQKSERREAVDLSPGYRNGYGKPTAANDEFGDDHGTVPSGSRNASRVGGQPLCSPDGRRREES